MSFQTGAGLVSSIFKFTSATPDATNVQVHELAHCGAPQAILVLQMQHTLQPIAPFIFGFLFVKATKLSNITCKLQTVLLKGCSVRILGQLIQFSIDRSKLLNWSRSSNMIFPYNKFWDGKK